MILKLSPIRLDAHLSLGHDADVLTINGEAFDFSGLPEGATLPREAVSSPWLASDVVRIDGELRLTLLLPHGAEAGPQTLFPAPLNVNSAGPVALPDHAVGVPQ